jgi:hypothetical protein
VPDEADGTGVPAILCASDVPAALTFSIVNHGPQPPAVPGRGMDSTRYFKYNGIPILLCSDRATAAAARQYDLGRDAVFLILTCTGNELAPAMRQNDYAAARKSEAQS